MITDFIICTVRGATPDVLAKQEAYVSALEKQGRIVHYPPRDTDQSACGFDICKQNAEAIQNAKVIHVFYSPTSQGTHFDMGVAFALTVLGGNGKRLVIAENGEVLPGKCYPRMLIEWQEQI